MEAEVTSLLLVKAHFYTHLLEPSKKMFAWEDRYIIHCSGASAMLIIVSAHLTPSSCCLFILAAMRILVLVMFCIPA